jgi:hypothetical protein
VLFAGALFLNSNMSGRIWPPSGSGRENSITDFNYYFQNLYAQYYSSMSGSAAISQLSAAKTGRVLKSQVYARTPADLVRFLQRMTIEQMKEDNKILVEALRVGHELTDEDKAAIEEEMETIRSTGISYGYAELEDYLKAMYGKGMNEKAFRKVLEQAHLVTSYTNYINDTFVYTPEQLEQYYTENKDKLDTFTYRNYHVQAQDPEKADFETTEAYDAAKAAAVDVTEARAAELDAKITDEASFIEAAREYDPEAYAEDDASRKVYQGELLGGTYGEWLRDASRKEGDHTTIRGTNGTYVVYFIGRDDNHYSTVNVRTIVCPPETVNPEDYAEDETTEAYDAAVQAADQAAKETADGILEILDSQGGTEQVFIDQTDLYNGTTQIDSENSGLKEQVYREQLPDEVAAWLFDASRAAGDYALIPTEDGPYYLVFFVSTDDMYSNVLADVKMRQDDLQAWKEALQKSEPQTTWLMTLI